MITMADIAARAGVSRSAVSHVLNERHGENIRIPDATRQRIWETAAELGYRPNQLARSVASGTTRMIGYLVSEPDYEPYWNPIVAALSEAETLGFTLKVLSVPGGKLEERVRQCVELRLGGIIARVIGDKTPLFEEAQRASIPVVIIDDGVPQPFGVSVIADDASGCDKALDHLTQFGHTRIGFISSGFARFRTGPDDGGDIGEARERLFRRAMSARGLDVPDGYMTRETMAVFGPARDEPDNQQSAWDATQALLRHPDGRPTAIVCWRDETAMVASRACRDFGLRVPADISVVGFSDITAARFFDPPLSTVQSPWDAMGRLALSQIARQTNQPFTLRPAMHLVATGFVARHSTGPTPATPRAQS